MSFRAIALTAGYTSRNALADSMTRSRVRPATMARILAVNPQRDNRRDSYTDATGSRRRLQALAVNGYSTRDLAARLGLKQATTVQDIASGKTPTVRYRTMDAIRDLYEELWDSREATPAARRSRRRRAGCRHSHGTTTSSTARTISRRTCDASACPVADQGSRWRTSRKHGSRATVRRGRSGGGSD
jgi:hypothetical protein